MSERVQRSVAATSTGEATPRSREKLIAGSIGGLITAFVITPFDVVKIRLQAQRNPFKPGQQFIYHDGILDHLCTCVGNHCPKNTSCKINIRKLVWYSRPSQFNGTADAFRKIVRNEGFTSLWSGLYPTIIISLPTVALYYTVYEVVRDALGFQTRPDSVLIPAVSAASARTLASSLFCPVEVLRTKMQSERLPASRLYSCVAEHVRLNGLSSLFLGLKASLLRDVPFSIIYWMLTEKTRAYLHRKYSLSNSSVATNVAAASFAGLCAASVTLPFDVVKTQTQMQLGAKNFSGTKAVPVSEALFNIWLKDGTRGLFAGFTPRLMRVVPACAIMLTSYEVGKSILAQ